jgi:uracil-DNA glycosylase
MAKIIQTSADLWQTLLTAVGGCHVCYGLPLGPNPILQFHPQAKLLIAGQAPGRITHGKGIPFDDPSGDRLRNWLGIDRETFYDPQKIAILPMGFCFPGTGKSGDLPPRPECAEQWREQLLAQLPNIELSLLIGRYALDWHLPEQQKLPITAIVADWKSYWPTRLPLPHPSPRNNRWLKNNPWFEAEVIPTLQQRVAGLLA